MKRAHEILLLTSLALLLPLPARAQSGLSEASRTSAQALLAVPRAGAELFVAGGQLSVVALHPVAEGTELLLRSSAGGVTFSARVTAEALEGAGIVAGSTIVAAAVTGGLLLSAAGEVIAFIPDASVVALTHQQELP